MDEVQRMLKEKKAEKAKREAEEKSQNDALEESQEEPKNDAPEEPKNDVPEEPKEEPKNDAPAESQEESKKPVSAHDLLADFMKAQTKAAELEPQVKALSRVTLGKATEKELRLVLRWHKEKKLAAKLSKELEERLK